MDSYANLQEAMATTAQLAEMQRKAFNLINMTYVHIKDRKLAAALISIGYNVSDPSKSYIVQKDDGTRVLSFAFDSSVSIKHEGINEPLTPSAFLNKYVETGKTPEAWMRKYPNSQLAAIFAYQQNIEAINTGLDSEDTTTVSVFDIGDGNMIYVTTGSERYEKLINDGYIAI